MAKRKNGADFAAQCKKDGANLAENMREARKKTFGMSQERIAEKIEVTTAYIGRIERNECKIPAYIVKKYCQILDVPPEDILRTGVSPLPSGTDEQILSELKSLPENEKAYILGIIRSMKQ